MRLNPENIDVEGAGDFTWVRRQYPSPTMPKRWSLPGAWAHVETSRKLTEERPKGKPGMVLQGMGVQGKTGARLSQRPLGVGLSHSSEEALLRSYKRLEADASAGIDGGYGKTLEENLRQLQERYRASPVRRVWIEKPGGGKRPLGIPTLADKIVQGAVVEILNSIYETDFMGFSYGSCPGRSAHQALQALQTVLQKGKGNWVLDADLSKFFDRIDHKELRSAIHHRVKDHRLLRLIGKWLAVGVVEEDGRRIREKKGTPQGGVISPLLANIFLHYVVG